jgi:hypothetical protein
MKLSWRLSKSLHYDKGLRLGLVVLMPVPNWKTETPSNRTMMESDC